MENVSLSEMELLVHKLSEVKKKLEEISEQEKKAQEVRRELGCRATSTSESGRRCRFPNRRIFAKRIRGCEDAAAG